jgi:CBS domain-containing protein
MHDHRFLSLPVCEEDGTVVGLVDVMDCVNGVGGADGWRSIFASAMDAGDDCSDTTSQTSAASTMRRSKTSKNLDLCAASVQSPSRASRAASKMDTRPVSQLRPKKPLIGYNTDTILSVCQMLAEKRGDAALICHEEGGLAGIVSDTDIVRRVVAKHVDPANAQIDSVMTPNPKCVESSSDAIDALGLMIENHFRHLPVTDEDGSVVGLLDIAKVLYDAIQKLERAEERGDSKETGMDEALASLKKVGGANAAALQALLGPLLQAVGGNSGVTTTLRSVLLGKPTVVVSPGMNIRDCAIKMAEARKAALVVDDDGELVGIFTFKDCMCRAVAKERPLELTAVESLMTPSPESVLPDMTVLEALQTMHDHRFLSLPVCEEDGTVVGMVDVMDCMLGVGGVDTWRTLFASAMDAGDDNSDTASQRSEGSTVQSSRRPPAQIVARAGSAVSRLHQYDQLPPSPGGSVINQSEINMMVGKAESEFTYKIADPDGNIHRIKTSARDIGVLKAQVGSKMGGVEMERVVLKFTDDEGDIVMITCDDTLREAVDVCRNQGGSVLKLSVEIKKAEAVGGGGEGGLGGADAAGSADNTNMMIAGAVGGLAVVLGFGMMMMKKR